MQIETTEDINQEDISDRKKIARCPRCGQKLIEIESLTTAGVFRVKCRRCKKYIRVNVTGKED